MLAKRDIQSRGEHFSIINTVSACVDKIVRDGFSESFNMTQNGLKSSSKSTTYLPEDISVVNFYRFEGQNDPGDNAIMYVIETSDGVKGTLIDAHGAYSDALINKFMQQIKTFGKKVITENKPHY